MTPEAHKLLAVVLARDGGFFDFKANVAARTELGASGYLRIESHGKQCRLTITLMGRTALALGSQGRALLHLAVCGGSELYSDPSMKTQFRSTYKTVSAARVFERDEPAPTSRPAQLSLKARLT